MFEDATLNPEHAKMFYHERNPQVLEWATNYRGIGFQIRRWEWARTVTEIAHSLDYPVYNSYIYFDVEKIPARFGPSSFWIKPTPWLMPLMPEVNLFVNAPFAVFSTWQAYRCFFIEPPSIRTRWRSMKLAEAELDKLWAELEALDGKEPGAEN